MYEKFIENIVYVIFENNTLNRNIIANPFILGGGGILIHWSCRSQGRLLPNVECHKPQILIINLMCNVSWRIGYM